MVAVGRLRIKKTAESEAALMIEPHSLIQSVKSSGGFGPQGSRQEQEGRGCLISGGPPSIPRFEGERSFRSC